MIDRALVLGGVGQGLLFFVVGAAASGQEFGGVVIFIGLITIMVALLNQVLTERFYRMQQYRDLPEGRRTLVHVTKTLVVLTLAAFAGILSLFILAAIVFMAPFFGGG